MEAQIGDMVWVPANTVIWSKKPKTGSSYKYLDEPRSLLVIDELDGFFKIVAFGSSWWVKKNRVHRTNKHYHNYGMEGR